MPKVSVIVVLYNSKKYIKPVFDAIFAQTAQPLDSLRSLGVDPERSRTGQREIIVEALAVINADDGAKAILERDYPQVKILDPGKNLWFAKGNNWAIRESSGEFIQLVNQDLILEPDYIEKLLKAFEDPKVAAATGKLLRYDFSAFAGNSYGGSAEALREGGEKNQKTNIIDSTGVIMSVSGRARDRGQLEEDKGQYDKMTDDNDRIVFGVSGAGPMYRRSALEEVKYCFPSPGASRHPLPLGEGKFEDDKCEYFDEDFVAYWEDVDLSWRLNNAGFQNVYVPDAVAYHGRTAGQAKGGYLHLWHFIKHHQKISPIIRQLNYKNHILMYIKNAKHIWHPAFVLRELAMLGYVLLFEISTLKIVPTLLRQIPRALKKRGAARRTA